MAKTNRTAISKPLARDEQVVVEHLGDETVIYDQQAHVTHALAPLAAAVYAYADGNHTVSEIAELAAYRLSAQVGEQDVRAALEELQAAALLDAPTMEISSGVTRRTALKAFAAAGAGSVLVLSLGTTAPAFAGSVSCTAPKGNSKTCATGTGAQTGASQTCVSPGVGHIPVYNPGFGSLGPGGCTLCNSSSQCSSGYICCCVPCGSTDNLCQPVCIPGSTCPSNLNPTFAKGNGFHPGKPMYSSPRSSALAVPAGADDCEATVPDSAYEIHCPQGYGLYNTDYSSPTCAAWGSDQCSNWNGPNGSPPSEPTIGSGVNGGATNVCSGIAP